MKITKSTPLLFSYKFFLLNLSVKHDQSEKDKNEKNRNENNKPRQFLVTSLAKEV